MKSLCIKKLVLFAGLFGLLANCGGASTGSAAAGTGSSTRTLTGSVTGGGGSALVKALTNVDCQADEVIATATDATTETASVDESCDFSLTLSIGKSYSIAFLLNDEFVASLVFDTGISAVTGTVMNIGDGTGDVNLGTITINGNTASPENEPLDQMDCDDDGTSDFDDADDDNDGIDDESDDSFGDNSDECSGDDSLTDDSCGADDESDDDSGDDSDDDDSGN